MQDFYDISQQASKDATGFIANPINAFLIIKKLSLDFKQLIDTINNTKRIQSIVNEIEGKYLLPTEEDYRGAIEGIHRLEDVYQLDTRDIRLGNLSKKYPSRPLSGKFI
jgi:prolyl 4-hydroxylase